MTHMHPDTPGNSDEEYDIISTPADAGGTTSAYERDKEYYCDIVAVRVETTIFKIPLNVLVQSEGFKRRYLAQRSKFCNIDDDTPLYLDNYTSSEFKLLLRVILPLRHGLYLYLCADESMSLLNIATGLEFPTVREVAIHQLAPYVRSDPILKIIAAKKYGIHDWLVPALNSLAQRDEPLGFRDVERLAAVGNPQDVMELVLCIARVRESFVIRAQTTTPADHHPLTTKCYKWHACSYHQVSTPCAGYTPSVTRAGYDFTPLIHDILGTPPLGQSASPPCSIWASDEMDHREEDENKPSTHVVESGAGADWAPVETLSSQDIAEGRAVHANHDDNAREHQGVVDEGVSETNRAQEETAALDLEHRINMEKKAALELETAAAEAQKLRKREAAARKRQQKAERRKLEEEQKQKEATDRLAETAEAKRKADAEAEHLCLDQEQHTTDEQATGASLVAEEQRSVDEAAERKRMADKQHRDGEEAKAAELYRLEEMEKLRIADEERRKIEEEAEAACVALEAKRKAEVEEKKRLADEDAKKKADDEATKQAREEADSKAKEVTAEYESVKADTDSLFEWGTPSKKKALRAKAFAAAQRKKDAEAAEIAALVIALPQTPIGGTPLAGTPVSGTPVNALSRHIGDPLAGSRPGSPQPPSRTSSPAPRLPSRISTPAPQPPSRTATPVSVPPSRISSPAPQQSAKSEAHAPAAPLSLSAEDQAKIEAAEAAVADAEKSLAAAQATAKPLKEAYEEREREVAKLELEGATNPVKKARASAARRRAATSAKAAIPVLRSLGEAEVRHAEALKTLEELKATLTAMDTPTTVNVLMTASAPEAPVESCTPATLTDSIHHHPH